MNKLPLIMTFCCVMGSFAVGAAEPTPAATQFADRVLRYPPGAPQLSYLNIEAMVVSPVPVLEPQNGRIAYNDDLTARVFTPVDGRVTRIVAKPGDAVRQGDPLAWLESPDYIQALADLNDARA
jgi:cobalt-zinc-cadmium efflux system membrane fusion protein